MLRRTFFKLLAALPFVGKTESVHFSRVNKTEDWATCGSAGSMWIYEVHPSVKTFTVAQLNAVLKNCTLGPKQARNT